MDRERQEPTFSTPDMTEMRFRTERERHVRHSEPGPPWAHIAAGVVLAIVIAMGLIEWNARRQAAAITRELTRPMTAEEEAQFKAEMARADKEMAAVLQEAMPKVRQIPLPQAEYMPLPLRPGERCIRGRRLQPIEGGWRDRPDEPC